MKLVKATEKDSEKLMHYYSRTQFQGPITLKFRRMFNFFNQYRLQSDDFATYMLLNEKDEIEALATIVFRDAWIEGQKETIGYATDLRVSSSRRATLTWSQHFLPVIETERDARNCKYIFTVVATSQKQAYNAFIRPRTIRRQMPRYYSFRRFQLASLHGLWPNHETPLKTVKVTPATESDISPLAEFIVSESQNRSLRFINEPSDFLKNLEKWRDLYLENFLIAKSMTGEILGCVAPWSPQQVQRSYALRYNSRAKNLKDFLGLMSFFNVSHTLPKIEGELKLRHLTHLYARNPDVFYALLYEAYKRAAKDETLVYPQFEGDLLTLPPESFISATQSFGLYCILSPNDQVPEFLKPKFMAPAIEFETAFL